MTEQGSNKRIVKNTIFLYIRSLLMMTINLFSSRVILQALGVEDYGLYGAIGSIVAMFTIINGVLSVGTSRFLTFELGKENAEKLKKTFSASFAMHVGLAIILFVLLESIGLWFVNNKMSIPEGREFAANIVFQLSIVTCMFTLTQVPYNASIISHERMNIYAYVGIAEALFKLSLVMFLLYIPTTDNLIAYAIILAIWSAGLQVYYRFYCYKRFPECHLSICKDKSIYKSMLSYSMWDFVGQFCVTGNTQGLNILINMFFGVVVNAARSVAYQVENAIMLFSRNFLTSVKPQIIKAYAQNDSSRFFELIYESGRFSYYLLFLISLPLIIEADYIISIWLVDVPPMTTLFLRFIICNSLFRAFANPVVDGVHATGHVRFLNLTSGLSAACTFLPVVYILYRFDMPVWYCFVVQAINYLISSVLEVWSLYREIKFDVFDYYLKVYLHSILVSMIAVIPSVIPLCFMEASFMRLVLTFAVSMASTAMTVYWLGISKDTRIKVKTIIVNKLKK